MSDVTMTGEPARARAAACGAPEPRRVVWMATAADGTVAFGYDDDRPPFTLPAIAPAR